MCSRATDLAKELAYPPAAIMTENGHSPQRAIDEDDDIRLSAETMAILGEFLIEQEQRECKKSAVDCQLNFEEDWVGLLDSLNPTFPISVGTSFLGSRRFFPDSIAEFKSILV